VGIWIDMDDQNLFLIAKRKKLSEFYFLRSSYAFVTLITLW
jgi:hypothetical protein